MTPRGRASPTPSAPTACPVVLVRVTAAADGADAVPGRTEAPPVAQPPEGWDVIVDDLAGHPEDIIVTKRNWGAFYGTDLDLQLRRRGVTQVVLAGIATSIGVESTARAAHEHGYHVTLATDAMTDLDAEAHRNSIERIFPRLGETGTTDEILETCWPRPAPDTGAGSPGGADPASRFVRRVPASPRLPPTGNPRAQSSRGFQCGGEL